MTDKPRWKITFDPSAEGEAYQTRYNKNGQLRKHGKPFLGQWVVFDINLKTHPGMPHYPGWTVFAAATSEECHGWIRAREDGGGLVPAVGAAEISIGATGLATPTAVPNALDTLFGPLLHPKTMLEIMSDLRAAGENPAIVKRQRYGKPAKMDTIVTIMDRRFASGKHGLPTIKDALKATAKIAAKIMKAPTEKKPSRASRIREMMDQGMSNKDIWPTIQKEFGMRDDQHAIVRFHRTMARQATARKHNG